MTLAILSHPDCVLHDPGEQHPERPARVTVIQKALEKYPFLSPVAFYEAPLATHDQLISVHDEAYVKWIKSIAPKEGRVGVDDDTLMDSHTYTAALRSAGAPPMAVDLVMQQKAQAVFCNIRPPGHHAERDKAMGFCFFNNLAIGVQHALDKYALNRIAIIDFDVHHGNGTQNIFQREKRVLFCSSFQHPFYPGYDVEMDNEHILNVPIPEGATGEKYRELVVHAWFEKIAAFQPELIFFSAGFDGHEKDPLANLHLLEADYVWLTEQIAKMAKVHCDGKMISVLEGGYHPKVLATCVPAHVNAMLMP